MNLFTRKMRLFCVSNIMVSFVCTGFLAIPSYAIDTENLEENSHAISLATSDTEPASRFGDEGVVNGALELFDDESPLDDDEEDVKPVTKKVSSSTKKSTVTRVVTKKEVASTKTYTPAKYSAVTGNAVVEYAKKYLGLRYVSGGNSLSTGTDCSGFTKLIYKEFGVTLSRAVRSQVGNGTYVRKADLQKGDLVFYGKKSGGGVTHVGIYMGNGEVIHESNHRDGVKISSVNMMRYITARRVINSKAIKIAEEKKLEEQKQLQQAVDNVTNNTDQTVKSSDVVETITDQKEEIKENNNVIENVQTTTNSQTETTSVNQSGVVETKEVKEEPKVVETKEETTNVSDTSKSDAVKEEPKKEETKTKEETTKVEETSQEVTE